MSTLNVLTKTKNSLNRVCWQELNCTYRLTSTQVQNGRTPKTLLNFSDHEAAFRSKRTGELVRACTILAACSSDRLVDNAHTLLHEGERWLGSRLFGALMRYTLYAQFVAGETGPAVPQTARALRQQGEEAMKRDLRLTVDMEWSYVNPMCSVLASALMVVFNGRSPVVCSTVQCYLKNALATLAQEEQVARLSGVCYGAKLVRGAYLERERQVAPNVVCNSYQDTSKNYNTVMESGVKNALHTEEGRYFLIVATHNEAAVHAATRLLAAQDATRTRNVAFAQIYGMAEHISLPLSQNGFCVYKSVAFGSLSKVLPYLARRAAENRAIMQGARRERQLLQNEISRRIRARLHF
ncbi:hypothetical protein B566_EDAN016554 [Ephemera danica]|nr:hypothetical protein B566_EDAN016554 [Ephemera danica]